VLLQKRCGGREVRCRRADVEVKTYDAPELGSHAAGVASKEVWRSGGALQACRCGGKEVWCSGAREPCCGPGDVEV